MFAEIAVTTFRTIDAHTDMLIIKLLLELVRCPHSYVSSLLVHIDTTVAATRVRLVRLETLLLVR